MTTLAPVQLEANGRRAFYNEIDRYCCDWLSNLMDAGRITPGKIDDRPIQELTPDDVRGYERAHFFAGVAGWDIALNLAGWRGPAWTGSCPCQPFSAAGAQRGGADERHLWPAWGALIAECRPATVFGEQVATAIKHGWLDTVFADLEAAGYACGAAVLPACGVSAPHIRQRLWFVADAGCGRVQPRPERGLGDANGPRLQERERDGRVQRQALGSSEGQAAERGSNACGFWSDVLWLPCTDGKARPIEPGSFPLAHGVLARPSKLRAYGNAIVPQVAAEFVAAFLDVRKG